MNKNVNLNKAKKAKNDEFYTRLEDIELELSNYPVEYFKDKVIYCPCDVGVEDLDIHKSNFIKYFEDNKDRLGYKKLIHTSLQEGFDYRSEYCQKLFKEADVVVTNPPFSLFRDFVAMLMEHEKKFLIIGNMNAITYKEIFPLFRDDKLWYGASIHSGDRKFGVPDSYPLDAAGCGIDENGQRYIKVKGVRWFTNLDYAARREKLVLWKEYNSEEYPKYDNYDAINVNKYSEIPMNYDGVMGVPITFMDFYCPEQFEILGYLRPKLNNKYLYSRLLIKRR